jgi:hypothetical protein
MAVEEPWRTGKKAVALAWHFLVACREQAPELLLHASHSLSEGCDAGMMGPRVGGFSVLGAKAFPKYIFLYQCQDMCTQIGRACLDIF